MSDKLLIQNEMAMVDLKKRDFYESLSDDEKKKFSCYLMIRWGSAVQGSADLQEFYVVSCNERLNKHFFAINKHPVLQWLCATTVSPNLGKFKHEWIAPKKKDSKGNTKIEKFLAKMHPFEKMEDLQLRAALMTPAEAREIAKQHGMTAEQIKKEIS